jgi:DNA-binding beta-propeller fold protein YncE
MSLNKMPYSVSRKPASVSKTKNSKFTSASDYTRYAGVFATVGNDSAITTAGSVGTFIDPPIVTTLTGLGPLTKTRDGATNFAQFQNPQGMVSDSLGNIYFCDTDNHLIRKRAVTTGTITTVAGSTSGFVNGEGSAAKFKNPEGIGINPNDEILYVADTGNHAIRVITLSVNSPAVVTTLAGSGTSGAGNGTGSFATFSSPRGVVYAPFDNYVFVADTGNHRIRRITLTGEFAGLTTTFAGGVSPGSGDGTVASFNGPRGIAAYSTDGMSTNTVIYIADTGNHLIRKITNVKTTPTTSTIAGSTQGYTDAIGILAQFDTPTNIAIDQVNRVLFVTDRGNQLIRSIKISNNSVSTNAGTSQTEGYTDGTGTAAVFSGPIGITIPEITSSGTTLYVSDSGKDIIRKIVVPSPVATTERYAGSLSESGLVNGDRLTEALLSQPYQVVIDYQKENMYIADAGNNCIRKIVLSTGVVSTLAGDGVAGLVDDRAGSECRFNRPLGIAIDGAGTFLYVADKDNHRIRKVDTSTGGTETIAGSGDPANGGGFVDGSALVVARFNEPYSVDVMPDGSYVFVADKYNHRIRRINTTTVQVDTAAGGEQGHADTTPTNNIIKFNKPQGIKLNTVGTELYVADLENFVIRKMTNIFSATPTVTTIAGFPGYSGYFDGSGNSARFSYLEFISIDINNAFLYVADNTYIRQIDLTGNIVRTFATLRDSQFLSAYRDQDGIYTYYSIKSNSISRIPDGVVQPGVVSTLTISPSYTNGAKTVSTLDDPRYAVLYGESTLYVIDSNNHCIRRVDISSGELSTVAGSEFGISGNRNGIGISQALCGLFNTPKGIVMNSTGTNLYISDTGNHRICKVVISTGEVTTLAGSTSGVSGTTNNTGTAARFNSPQGITMDSSEETLYVADTANHSIRKIVISTGVVTTFAGLSGTSGNTNNTGTSARFSSPQGITIDSTNANLYVADTANTRIRKIVISTAGVTTLAGSTTGYTDDTGTSAKFKSPTTVNVDRAGTGLFVCDDEIPAIRKIVISTGVVSTFTGGATAGYRDGLLTDGLYGIPSSVSESPSGKLYFCDRLSTTNKIRNTVPETTRTVTGDDILVKGAASKRLPSASWFTAIRSVILRN